MQFIPYSLYKGLIRPFIFMLDPEHAHELTIKAGKILSKPRLKEIFKQEVEYRPVKLMGLEFKNPVGLAAGLDKNGDAIDYFGALGFGHIEVGTITPKAQDGNPKPRMFRIVEANGIINRMGFPNKGVDYLVENLKKRTYKGILGVSIGKNETTSIEDSSKDYIICMEKVYEYADYIAVNVSCPNTPDLTQLQTSEHLTKLLKPIKEKQLELQKQYNKYVPLVVKIAPDLNEKEVVALCNCCIDLGMDAISCTNTTTTRHMVKGLSHAGEWGGLSGAPLRALSLDTLKKVKKCVGDRLPIIGLGGINDVTSAREKIENGASLVQIYSGLIYEGPALIKNIVKNI